jgi:signal transduction histidine kinase
VTPAPTPLRVLNLEDSVNDAELLQIQLRRAGFDATTTRVDTAEGFMAALESGGWDLVIADHSMPSFDAPAALKILKDKRLDLPFIVMSGAISAELAINLMQSGAHDFVSKNEPARLAPVIRRELREATNRRARHKAEEDRAATLVELEVANRAKDEFLAMLGHELRNPLAPIVTALQLMKLRGDGVLRREREVIERQVQHLLRLVDDLFDVAKIARGKIELKRRPLELAAAVAQAIEMASPLLEQREHRFTVDVPSRGLMVDADQARLAQVLSNLLTNAARYTLPKGDISLSARVEGGEVVVRVKDSGIGIDADMLPKIFEVFVQGSRAIDRSEGGLGIGLALVRNLVALHGGSVSAYSGGRDAGSEFVVRLPSAPAAVAEPLHDAIATPLAHADRNGSCVLLVDDNHDALELLSEAVRIQGYDVRTASDGPTALAALDHFTPNVVVLDIGLPVMDGYEVARLIRARPEHRATTLIALTGYGQSEDRARARDAGFDVHLVKPIQLAQLVAAIDRARSARSGSAATS